MNAIKAFLSKYSAVTHVVVVAWVFLAGAYGTVAPFREYVNSLATGVAHAAPWLGTLFVMALVPLFKYWQGLSDTGKVDIANEANAKAKTGTLKSKTPLTSAKVGVLALCSLLLMSTTTACSSADVQKVVSQINASLPTVEAIVGDAAAVASAIDPVLSPLIGGSNAAIQLGLQELSTLATNYLANPDTGTYAKIEQVVDSLVQNGDAALLAASHIKDAASQSKAVSIIASLDAALHVFDTLVASTQSTSVVKARMATRSVKLKQLSQLWSARDKATVSAQFHAPFSVLLDRATVEGM
jgi:hypothetical protein